MPGWDGDTVWAEGVGCADLDQRVPVVAVVSRSAQSVLFGVAPHGPLTIATAAAVLWLRCWRRAGCRRAGRRGSIEWQRCGYESPHDHAMGWIQPATGLGLDDLEQDRAEFF